jgi:hypothetical protein
VGRVTPTINPLIDGSLIRSIEPLVRVTSKNYIKQYVVLLCVGNNGGYFISRQMQMYPVAENGRPRDKENPAFYHKSSKLFTFSKWKLGKRILGFHLGISVIN